MYEKKGINIPENANELIANSHPLGGVAVFGIGHEGLNVRAIVMVQGCPECQNSYVVRMSIKQAEAMVQLLTEALAVNELKTKGTTVQ